MPDKPYDRRWLDSVTVGDLRARRAHEHDEPLRDMRVLGMNDVSRLCSSSLKAAARAAEANLESKGQADQEVTVALPTEVLLAQVSAKTAEAIRAHIEKRRAQGLDTTPDDLVKFSLHLASRGRRGSQYPLTTELMRVDQTDRDLLVKMRASGSSYDERADYLDKSPNQRRKRAILLELGLAQMIVLGDWSVNRDKAVTDGLGIVTFDRVEAQLLNFYRHHGVLETDAPLKRHKLIHFHAGCGNGALMEGLRQSTIEPFDNGRRVVDYFSEIGFADRIYFQLDDLILKFVKDEYRDDPGLRDFIKKVVVTLLLRKIYFARPQNREDISYEMSRLLDMQKDVNILREIIGNLPDYIRNLGRLREIRGDGEFLRDTEAALSRECLELIAEYLGDSPKEPSARWLANAKATTDLAAGKSVKGPVAFLHKYFKPEFFDDKVNLAEHITIYPHNVIFGNFEEVEETFPEDINAFDIVHTFRAASHLEDDEYRTFMCKLCKRLKPGGILFDDGYRESYTRYERIDEWLRLAQELGPEYRVEVIADDSGPKSIFVQRAIAQDDGSLVFFSDTDKRTLLSSGCSTIPMEEFATTWPERMVRSYVIGELKKRVFIDATFTPDQEPSERRASVSRGRLGFTGLHGRIDEVLKEKIFDLPEWKLVREEASDSPRRRAIDMQAFGIVTMEIESINRQLRLVLQGAELLGEDRAVVRTYPLSNNLGNAGIDRQRVFLTRDLPRNIYVPENEALVAEAKELRENLQAIMELNGGKSPLALLEFDDCFTNLLMQMVMIEALALGLTDEERKDPQAPSFFDTHNVKLRSREYPQIEDGRIYILGGSTNDVFDPLGDAFTQEFTFHLLERIAGGKPNRLFAECFGSQSALNAYGKLIGKPFRTRRAALQFGAFPIRFGREHVCLKYLGGQTCTVAMTRSGYSEMPGYEEVPDVVPLASECSGIIKPNKWGIDTRVPPVAFALLGGKAVTTQFHLELRLRYASTRKILAKYFRRNHHDLRRIFEIEHDFSGTVPIHGLSEASSDGCNFSSSRPKKKRNLPYYPPKSKHGPRHVYGIPDSIHAIPRDNINLLAQDKTGATVPWVARDPCHAFLIPTLNHLARTLRAQLEKERRVATAPTA